MWYFPHGHLGPPPQQKGKMHVVKYYVSFSRALTTQKESHHRLRIYIPGIDDIPKL
jgi:hypothetical protein